MIASIFPPQRKPWEPEPLYQVSPETKTLKPKAEEVVSGRCNIHLVRGACEVRNGNFTELALPIGQDYYGDSALKLIAGPEGCTLEIIRPRLRKVY